MKCLLVEWIFNYRRLKNFRRKADTLGISDKVFTIDSFLEKTFAEHPDLVNYKVLNVQKLKFWQNKS